MNVTRNPKHEIWLLDQIRESFKKDSARRNAVIHLTDCLKPRIGYWQRVLPLPATNADCLYFLAGRGHEDALGRVAGLLVVTDEREHDGVHYRPDFTMFDVPAEFKTRRANLAKPGEELTKYDNYLDQLRGYVAMERARQGKPVTRAFLAVLSLLEGRSNDPLKPTEPELAMYDVEFDDVELDAEYKHLLTNKNSLLAALQLASAAPVPAMSDAHTPLPLCPDWLCGKPRRVTDKDAYCRACGKDINHKPRHKHLASGDVTPEQFHWEYEPKCRWYYLCKPWLVDPNRQERRGDTS